MLFIFKDEIPPKKNSKEIISFKWKWNKRKHTLISSDRYTLWNDFIKEYHKEIMYDKNLCPYKYSNEDNIKFKAIFFPKTNKKFDLTNIIQSIEDTFKDSGIIKEDNFKVISNFNYRVSHNIKENKKSDIFLILEIENNKNLDISNIEKVDYNNILSAYNSNEYIIWMNDIDKYKEKKEEIKEKSNKKKIKKENNENIVYFDPNDY